MTFSSAPAAFTRRVGRITPLSMDELSAILRFTGNSFWVDDAAVLVLLVRGGTAPPLDAATFKGGEAMASVLCSGQCSKRIAELLAVPLPRALLVLGR